MPLVRADRRRRGAVLSVPDDVLRPALELAWVVALQGARVRPPVPPPAGLRPFLRFHKLPNAALGPVRKAVETDDAFRRRLAAIATEDNAGRAGVLWLARPDDWQAELEQLAMEAAAGREAEVGAKAERDARKRLDAAEHATRAALAEAAAATTALTAERDRRDTAERALAKAERRLAQLDIELGGARRRIEQANAESATARDQATEARAATEATQRLLDAAREAGTEALAELALVRAAPTSPPPPVEPAAAAPSGELAAAARALQEAAEATARLGQALAAAASSLAPGQAVPPATAPARQVARTHRRRRRPVPLPGGVFDDTLAAATHLVRLPGMVLVVDGYNVAKLGWPDLGLPAQRERLLDALDELAARFGTDVQVVFDGAEVEPAPVLRRQVRVRFSPPGVLADDVIVELVRELPADQPVVVATNDGEVRVRSRAEGANLVASDQLLALARRC